MLLPHTEFRCLSATQAGRPSSNARLVVDGGGAEHYELAVEGVLYDLAPLVGAEIVGRDINPCGDKPLGGRVRHVLCRVVHRVVHDRRLP